MSDLTRNEARKRLLDQVYAARTLSEIAVARDALRAWLQTYPDEPGMADAFEVLSHREDFAREQEKAHSPFPQ